MLLSCRLNILTHVRDFELIEAFRDAYHYQMVTKPKRSKLGQAANINDLILVNDEFFGTEIEHCCPLCKGDHQDCLLDLSTSSKTIFYFS